MDPLRPYLLRDLAPLRAVYKRSPEDFEVEELGMEPASGEGEHVLARIEKRSLTTPQAIERLARLLGLDPRRVGYAGLKDSRAVTTQWLSFHGVTPEAVRALDSRGVRVLEADRHRCALRIGRLSGNRFRLRLREVDPERLDDLRAGLDTLGRRGVPNAFGPQRFGRRGDTWRVGEAYLREDWDELVDLICGRPTERDTGPVLRARQLYEGGELEAAAKAMPRFVPEARRLLRALVRHRGDKARAAECLERRERRFYISAWQARLFNRVLQARLASDGPGIDALMEGDLAWKHDSGAVFHVEQPQEERARLSAFEISPSGPLCGTRMTEPLGEAARFEEQVLDGDQALAEGAPTKGARRAMRFPIREVELEERADEEGEHVELCFRLPSGCYATSVLEELCKDALVEGLERK